MRKTRARDRLLAAVGAIAFGLMAVFKATVASAAPVAGLPEGLTVEVVAEGLEIPWGVAFAPDGRIFVTERSGRIRVIEQGRLREEPWAEMDVAEAGEAGLMGIALDPDFDENGYVYVLGTFWSGPWLVNRVQRLRDEEGRGVDPEVLVDDIPAARIHAGGALAFGPDGKLYVTAGDAGVPDSAQDPDFLAGKILRYERDGSIPPDNPIPGSPVYALGVRNPQGLAWHPETGDLFATEHGPSGLPREDGRRHHDELNHIVPGGNYGWPAVAGWGGAPDFIDPLAVWTPAVAPSGLAVYGGDALPWHGDVLIATLRGGHLRRLSLERVSDRAGRPVTGDRAPGDGASWRVTGEELLLAGEFGRLRAVVVGPDGYVYLTTSNRDGRGHPAATDDRVLRIVPR